MSERGKHRDGDEWWADRTTGEKIVVGIVLGLIGLGLLAFFGWIVMQLWNWIMPLVFGLTTLTYWQTWGVLLLSCILFRGGRSGNGGSRNNRKRKRELRRAIREENAAIDEEPGPADPAPGAFA